MDLPQILLLVVIFAVAVILIIIGVQIIFLLQDAKQTLAKADHILGDVEFLSRGLTRSTASVEHLVVGLQSGMQVVGLVSKLLSSVSSKKEAK